MNSVIFHIKLQKFSDVDNRKWLWIIESRKLVITNFQIPISITIF